MADETKRAYSTEVQNKLETYNESEIETEWTNIKATIIEAAEKTIGLRTREHTKEWFDKECQHMREKKPSKKEMDSNRNTTRVEQPQEVKTRNK